MILGTCGKWRGAKIWSTRNGEGRLSLELVDGSSLSYNLIRWGGEGEAANKLIERERESRWDEQPEKVLTHPPLQTDLLVENTLLSVRREYLLGILVPELALVFYEAMRIVPPCPKEV